MSSEEYEDVSSDTHTLGVIVSIAEFDTHGVPIRATPAVHEIDEKIGGGMAIGRVRFNAPEQSPETYRYIADVLRDIADDCEKTADKAEERNNND